MTSGTSVLIGKLLNQEMARCRAAVEEAEENVKAEMIIHPEVETLIFALESLCNAFEAREELWGEF